MAGCWPWAATSQHGRGSLPAGLVAVPRRCSARRAKAAAWRQYLAAWVACVAGVTAGAAMVPIEAAAERRAASPLGQFLGVMIGVHLLIALGEGAIDLRRDRLPAAGPAGVAGPRTPADAPAAAARPGYGAVAASLLVTALLLAGVVSWFASTWPDGLEWSYRSTATAGREGACSNESPVVAAVDQWQGRWSLHARLHPARSAAGPVARRGDGGIRLGPALRGRLAVAGRHAGHARHPGPRLRRVA